MNVRTLLASALLAVSSCLAANNAHAQCGYGMGYGAYGAWDLGRLYGVMANNVPYFSAFPPVYYSLPVARTYGYSPFAYPPGVMTPEVEMAQPLAIENPYFKGSSTAVNAGNGGSAVKPADAAPVDRTTKAKSHPQPLVVVNPFVTQQVQTAAYSN